MFNQSWAWAKQFQFQSMTIQIMYHFFIDIDLFYIVHIFFSISLFLLILIGQPNWYNRAELWFSLCQIRGEQIRSIHLLSTQNEWKRWGKNPPIRFPFTSAQKPSIFLFSRLTRCWFLIPFGFSFSIRIRNVLQHLRRFWILWFVSLLWFWSQQRNESNQIRSNRNTNANITIKSPCKHLSHAVCAFPLFSRTLPISFISFQTLSLSLSLSISHLCVYVSVWLWCIKSNRFVKNTNNTNKFS